MPLRLWRSPLARRVAAGALLVVPSAFAGAVIGAPAAHAATSTRSVTFTATGAAQTWTVPDGIYAVQAVVDGGQGAAGGGAPGVGSGGTGGAAAEVITTFSTTPGESLTVDAGSAGQPTDGLYNGGQGGWGAYPGGDGGTSYTLAGAGGGGGGASALLRGTDPLVVAGGGGGGGGGGDVTGYDGGQGGGHTTAGSLAGGNGNGPGAGSGGSLRDSGGNGGPGDAVVFTFGGSGGGGGGGYRGGAGGHGGDAGAGGGGGGGGAMSYVDPNNTDAQFSSAGNRGNGSVVLTFAPPSTVTVTASPSTPTYGSDVTVTVGVTAPNGVPSGNVQLLTGVFQLKTLVCGFYNPLVDGSFTCTVPAHEFDAGANQITAIFVPDDDLLAIAGGHGSVPIPVAKAPTTTSLTSSANPSTPGSPVTLVATVGTAASGVLALTGTVTFADGTTNLCASVAVAPDRTARCTTSSLSSGSHDITATYSGDTRYLSSSSGSPLHQVVFGPPVALPAPVNPVRSRGTTTVDGSDSFDPQSEALTYSWTQIGGPPAVIADPDKAKTTVTMPTGAADVTLRLTVTDTSGLTGTSDVVIHVRAPK